MTAKGFYQQSQVLDEENLTKINPEMSDHMLVSSTLVKIQRK
jgi:hypothetical protein